MSVQRFGTTERIPGSNPPRYRGRLRLDDGTRGPRIMIPEPICFDRKQSAAFVLQLQQQEAGVSPVELSDTKARNGAGSVERRGTLWWARITAPNKPRKRLPIAGSEKWTRAEAKRETEKLAADYAAGRITWDEMTLRTAKGAIVAARTQLARDLRPLVRVFRRSSDLPWPMAFDEFLWATERAFHSLSNGRHLGSMEKR